MTNNNITFGELDWDAELPQKGKKIDYKDLYLRLEEGSNEVRIVTNPHQYLMHKVKKDANNPKDFGVRVNCSSAHGKCPICESGDKPKARWLFGVIDAKTNSYKVLDVSYSVFSQLKTLTKSPKWGPIVSSYDLEIIVNKNASPQDYYRVVPAGKSPLTADMQRMKDNADLDYLKSRTTPPTYEEVQERVEKILGTSTLTPTTTNKVDMSETSEFDFPSNV